MADVGSLERMGRELKCPIWYAAAAAAALLRPAFSFAFLDPYYFVCIRLLVIFVEVFSYVSAIPPW